MKRKPKPARKAEIISDLPAVPTRDLARLLNVSLKTIATWAASGVVVRVGYGKYDLAGSIQGFARHMKAITERSGDAEGSVSAERVLYLRVRREREELELGKARGDLVSYSAVVDEFAANCKIVRNELLQIHTTLLNSSVHHTVAKLVDDKIREALTRLADGELEGLEYAREEENHEDHNRGRAKGAQGRMAEGPLA